MTQNEPNAMKEIHAIRVDNFIRTKDMPPDERSRLRSESAIPIAEEYGFRIVPRRKEAAYCRRDSNITGTRE